MEIVRWFKLAGRHPATGAGKNIVLYGTLSKCLHRKAYSWFEIGSCFEVVFL
jgi:hypothetical protein